MDKESLRALVDDPKSTRSRHLVAQLMRSHRSQLARRLEQTRFAAGGGGGSPTRPGEEELPLEVLSELRSMLATDAAVAAAADGPRCVPSPLPAGLLSVTRFGGPAAPPAPRPASVTAPSPPTVPPRVSIPLRASVPPRTSSAASAADRGAISPALDPLRARDPSPGAVLRSWLVSDASSVPAPNAVTTRGAASAPTPDSASTSAPTSSSASACLPPAVAVSRSGGAEGCSVTDSSAATPTATSAVNSGAAPRQDCNRFFSLSGSAGRAGSGVSSARDLPRSPPPVVVSRSSGPSRQRVPLTAGEIFSGSGAPRRGPLPNVAAPRGNCGGRRHWECRSCFAQSWVNTCRIFRRHVTDIEKDVDTLSATLSGREPSWQNLLRLSMVESQILGQVDEMEEQVQKLQAEMRRMRQISRHLREVRLKSMSFGRDVRTDDYRLPPELHDSDVYSSLLALARQSGNQLVLQMAPGTEGPAVGGSEVEADAEEEPRLSVADMAAVKMEAEDGDEAGPAGDGGNAGGYDGSTAGDVWRTSGDARRQSGDQRRTSGDKERPGADGGTARGDERRAVETGMRTEGAARRKGAARSRTESEQAESGLSDDAAPACRRLLDDLGVPIVSVKLHGSSAFVLTAEMVLHRYGLPADVTTDVQAQATLRLPLAAPSAARPRPRPTCMLVKQVGSHAHVLVGDDQGGLSLVRDAPTSARCKIRTLQVGERISSLASKGERLYIGGEAFFAIVSFKHLIALDAPPETPLQLWPPGRVLLHWRATVGDVVSLSPFHQLSGDQVALCLPGLPLEIRDGLDGELLESSGPCAAERPCLLVTRWGHAIYAVRTAANSAANAATTSLCAVDLEGLSCAGGCWRLRQPVTAADAGGSHLFLGLQDGGLRLMQALGQGGTGSSPFGLRSVQQLRSAGAAPLRALSVRNGKVVTGSAAGLVELFVVPGT
ncbi:uncharacterized protein LOC119094389 [Pollicipes pollicipes]|uniref:uncharacterized protein LOC119094389 n=1 Tax=Pollicipes pollicipes TaxID=41117 RepID=UPI00188533CC|nr:uncharacterized protein LOC119094389 [Pollicipes pollicipes]